MPRRFLGFVVAFAGFSAAGCFSGGEFQPVSVASQRNPDGRLGYADASGRDCDAGSRGCSRIAMALLAAGSVSVGVVPQHGGGCCRCSVGITNGGGDEWILGIMKVSGVCPRHGCP